MAVPLSEREPGSLVAHCESRSLCGDPLMCICIWPPIDISISICQIQRYSDTLCLFWRATHSHCFLINLQRLPLFIQSTYINLAFGLLICQNVWLNFRTASRFFVIWKIYICFFQPLRRKNFTTLLFITRFAQQLFCSLSYYILFLFIFILMGRSCRYFFACHAVVFDYFGISLGMCECVGLVFLPFAHCVFPLTELSRLE